jgi:hypothetical protein
MEDYLLVHYLRGKPYVNDNGYWEIECYVEYEDEFSNDVIILDSKESADVFESYFKTQNSVMNPLKINMGVSDD